MANLNAADPGDDSAEKSPGGFVLATSQTGSLEVTWPAFEAAELHVWILLADPRELDPGALHPENLLGQLIRVPVEAPAGRATVYVPTRRPLGVTLVARTQAGDLLTPPSFAVVSGKPSARTVEAVSPAPAAATSRPERPAETVARPEPAGETPRSALGIPSARSTPQPVERPRIPLVFAAAGSASPTWRAAGPGEVGVPRAPLPDIDSFDALRARVAALASLAPAPEPAEKNRAGFGVKQRFTLTRLVFPSDSLNARRVLVAQPTFIGRTDLESWRADPPSWGFPVEVGCDGVIDGLAPEDQVVFYALLVDSPAGWTAAVLTPSAPPFTDIQRPLVLGNARARLEAALATSTSDALTELLQLALHPLPVAPEGLP